MQLPPYVRSLIERKTESVRFPDLKLAAADLSAAYREGRPISTPHFVEAYLATRMPATYAAARRALAEIPGPVASILDAGAGSGAAALAARDLFPEASITLLERNHDLAEAARDFLPQAAHLSADLTKTPTFPPHDLVIAAYSLGELGVQALPVATRLFQSARVAFAVIEPGTTKGFALIRALRDDLLARGACVLAPCPGPVPCPMLEGDWCHFAARVERSSLHRRLKDGDLGYEDEKFSYVVFTKEPVAGSAAARVLRHPRTNPGLIELTLCTPQGLDHRRVLKRDRAAFRAARRADWGSRFA